MKTVKKNMEKKREAIRENYSSVAKGSSSGCCGGSSCCSSSADPKEISKLLGYSEDDLDMIPSGSNMGLGCGNPIEIARIQKGETVLDLGSGGGFDCFLASRFTGSEGHVIGVDMTPDMVSLARRCADEEGYENVEFRLGEIEHLPVADSSVDVIISNCVLNLSLDKAQVFKDAYRVLRPGGRLAISDVAATCELPEEIKNDLSMISACIGGAIHYKELGKLIRKAGFDEVRLRAKKNSKDIVRDWAPGISPEDYITSFYIQAVKPV